MDADPNDGAADRDLGRLYARAFAEFGTACLWSRRPVPDPTPVHARIIAQALEREGGREAWRLARLLEAACDAADGLPPHRPPPEASGARPAAGVSGPCAGGSPDVDGAVDTLLAAADRGAARDVADLMRIERDVPLGFLAWAAAAKSPERGPLMLLGALRRRARLRQEDLDREDLAHPLQAAELNGWLRAACDRAEAWIASVPARFAFGLFVDRAGRVGVPDFGTEPAEDWSIRPEERGSD